MVMVKVPQLVVSALVLAPTMAFGMTLIWEIQIFVLVAEQKADLEKPSFSKLEIFPAGFGTFTSLRIRSWNLECEEQGKRMA